MRFPVYTRPPSKEHGYLVFDRALTAFEVMLLEDEDKTDSLKIID